ncbi:hypothetical protein JCGZ_19988 [Jatropha curcas]|uniref:Uncharacterized protein n=1 Tax=Jatropha curcas TaxID=180498 RepID=A0A067JUZ3_JATCU|nr:hypothetical protein JCGZ_19988 [Jatropha curcas]
MEKTRALTKDRNSHLDASLRLSAQVEELSKRVEEKDGMICQARANAIGAETNVDFVTRATNNMLLC